MNDETKPVSFEFAPLPPTAIPVTANGPAPPSQPQQAPRRRGRKPGSANKRLAVKRTREALPRAVAEEPQADRRKLVLQAIQMLGALDKTEARFVASLFA